MALLSKPPPLPPPTHILIVPQQKFLRAKLTDGSTVEFDSEPLASGGEKIVFFTKDKKHVVAFFFGHVKDPGERRRRLEKIIGPYNPTIGGAQADYWRKHFCWPVGIIDNDLSLPAEFIKRHNIFRPVLGVVAPAYRSNFFFKDRTGNTREKKGRWFTGVKSRKLVPEEERGTLLTYLQCCSVMASSVRRLHFAGLAHSDLSHNNVLIDPKHGDASVIDCDSLVVPGLAPPTVMGTAGYIAPEVIAGRKQPSIETDLHALAVLIYESLLLRHPLMGPKVRSTRSPEEDDRLSMGAQAIYVEHPTDASNRLKPTPEIPVARLGPYLQNLFIKTFVVGLHAPHLRASASEWEKGLHKTLDLIHPSPDGKNWFIVAKGLPLVCPYSKRKLAAPVPVATFLRRQNRPGTDTMDFNHDDHEFTIWNGQYFYAWHTRSNISPLDAKRDPAGYFTFHQGKWYLMNLSNADMCLVDNNDYLQHGHPVELTPGLRVLLSLEDGGRLAVFDFLKS